MSDLGVSVGDPEIDAILQGGGAGMLPEQDAIGGFHNFPVGMGPNLGGPGQNAPAGGRFSASEMKPGLNAPYTNTYINDLWRGMPLEFRVQLQDALVSLGLTKNVRPGEFDDETEFGIEQLLKLSNRAGTTWQATIGRLQTLKDQGLLDGDDDERQFIEDAYLPPDYATLAQTVKQTVRGVLGRDPSDSEVSELAAQLQGFDYSAFQAEIDAERAQFDAQTAGATKVEATGAQVDPASRFRELIESKYGDEIAFNQRREEATENRQLTLGAVGAIDNIIQGF